MNDPETTGGPVSFRPGHAARYTTIKESLTCMLPPTTGVKGVSLVGFMVRTATVIAQDTQRRRRIVSLDAHMMFPQLFKPKYEFVKAALKLGIAWGGIGFVSLMLFLTIFGCTSDAQNIRATNEAVATPAATSTPLSAEIGWTEIQDGDCITSRLPEGIEIESVVIVPCSADWQYRALNSFTVEDLQRYPGEDLFSQRAYKECDRRSTNTLFPTADSWALGDRRVTCLQESFGLSGTDPAKLDRLVNSSRLNTEECFNEAPVTEGLSVELVSCSGEWQYRALSSLTVDDLDRYPGEGLFSQRAYKECDRRYTITLYPTADSWALGDRRVNCLQGSFGLSGTDPSMLDRLVNSSRLNTGECFNEAPETDYLLVELVDCSAEWAYRTLNSFTVDDLDQYPGEDLFSQRAYDECDRHHTDYSFPTADTWAVGHRTITCLQGSFGLSGTDPAKLDRLVDLNSLSVDECFNEAPETEYALVELVSCSDEWESQVIGQFLIPLDDAFPGEDYVEAIANQECDDSFDFYYSPIAETWSLGDRSVICVKSAE